MAKTEVMAMPSTNAKKKTVSIRRVNNGYVVDISWRAADDYKEQTYIAIDKKAAKQLADKALR